MATASDRTRNILILVGGALSAGVLLGISRLFGGVWYCPFKAVTGLPCPGCGGLRAFELLTQGKVAEALWTNPLSVAAMLFFAVSAVWLFVDIVRDGRTWLDFWGRRWPLWAVIVAVTVLLLNWGWNIHKGL